MIFSRSNQGLDNIHLFFGVKKIIYIEGEDNDKKFDKKFYELIYEKIIGIDLSDIHIQPLGSSLNVFNRYLEIKSSNIQNSICIMDRDYNNLKSSYLYDSDILKFSYGYSWESDLWTENLMLKTIDFLSGIRLINEIDKIKELINNTFLRAKKLSIIDMLAQIHGSCVLIKSSNSFGMRILYDENTNSLISNHEYKRLRLKLNSMIENNCKVSKDLYKDAKKSSNKNLIQGHFLEKICIELILKSLSNLRCATTICYELICNSAHSIFIQNFEYLMSEETKSYYYANFKINF